MRVRIKGNQVPYFNSKPLFELVTIITSYHPGNSLSMMARKEAIGTPIATAQSPSISVFQIQMVCMCMHAQLYMDVY